MSSDGSELTVSLFFLFCFFCFITDLFAEYVPRLSARIQVSSVNGYRWGKSITWNKKNMINSFGDYPTALDNIYFDQMVDRIYPTELQLNRANSSDTEAPFLDLNLFISNGTVSTKIYVKRDEFDFDIVNFPFLDGDVPRRTSYGVYISQLIRFARASSNLNDFNYRNKALTAKLLRQGYRYFKLFSKFIADTVPC